MAIATHTSVEYYMRLPILELDEVIKDIEEITGK
jgi:hypothetical protein